MHIYLPEGCEKVAVDLRDQYSAKLLHRPGMLGDVEACHMCHTAYVESPVHLTRGHRAHFEKELSLPGRRKLLPRRSCRKLMDACTRRTVSNPEGKSSSCVVEHQSICCFGQG